MPTHDPAGEADCARAGAEQPYRNLFEEMQEGAAILTTDGTITYCNRRFAELVAAPPDEVVGGPVSRFVSNADHAPLAALLLAGTGKRRAYLLAATGRSVDVYLSLTSTVTDESERRSLIVTDLSELVDAQTGRDRAEQESHAKDEFMAMLAHELRNPLSAISAALYILEKARASDERASRARSVIMRQVQHLSRLVDDLLDVGRVVTGKIALERHPVDFAELIQRSAAVLGETSIDRRLEVTTEPVWVDGDLVRLEQIVMNILGNAAKYTPAGGTIRVKLVADAGEGQLTVEDDGFGMTPELLRRAFDPFVQGERTLDRAQGGLGIGLTLVRRLVELHGGTVSAFSEGPARGSTFTVRLPRIGPPDMHAAVATAGCEAPRRRVAIIEDNRDAREMLRVMLELAGHNVIEAEEGLGGIELLKAEHPDIAIIDIGLPGLSGYEVARRFRSEPDGERVLLVALTGYGTPDARERSRQAGFDRHLIKPVDVETLHALINDAGTAAVQRGLPTRRKNAGLAGPRG